MLLHRIIKNIQTKRRDNKNKKGGLSILLEFILLLPAFVALVLILVDVMKFYYLYNVASYAAYQGAYQFSMSANIESSMKSTQEALELGGIYDNTFHTNDVKVWIYKYDKVKKEMPSRTSGAGCNSINRWCVSQNKKGLTQPSMTGVYPTYNNNTMLNREIYGVELEFKNKLYSSITLSQFTGINVMTVPVIANNHIFEMQRFDN